eukprot:3158550-Rhodomonas_salina.2
MLQGWAETAMLQGWRGGRGQREIGLDRGLRWESRRGTVLCGHCVSRIGECVSRRGFPEREDEAVELWAAALIACAAALMAFIHQLSDPLLAPCLQSILYPPEHPRIRSETPYRHTSLPTYPRTPHTSVPQRLTSVPHLRTSVPPYHTSVPYLRTSVPPYHSSVPYLRTSVPPYHTSVPNLC